MIYNYNFTINNMNTNKRPHTPTSPLSSNKKQQLEKTDDKEVEEKNKEVEDKNKEVEEKNKEVEDKNKEVEEKDNEEVNSSDNEEVNSSDNEEVNSSDNNSDTDNLYKEELNYCCCCNKGIKMESQICGSCAREMSYF